MGRKYASIEDHSSRSPLFSANGRSEAVSGHINVDGRTSASADKRLVRRCKRASGLRVHSGHPQTEGERQKWVRLRKSVVGSSSASFSRSTRPATPPPVRHRARVRSVRSCPAVAGLRVPAQTDSRWQISARADSKNHAPQHRSPAGYAHLFGIASVQCSPRGTCNDHDLDFPGIPAGR